MMTLEESAEKVFKCLSRNKLPDVDIFEGFIRDVNGISEDYISTIPVLVELYSFCLEKYESPFSEYDNIDSEDDEILNSIIELIRLVIRRDLGIEKFGDNLFESLLKQVLTDLKMRDADFLEKELRKIMRMQSVGPRNIDEDGGLELIENLKLINNIIKYNKLNDINKVIK